MRYPTSLIKKSVLPALVATCGWQMPATGAAIAPSYDLVRLGLTDAEHTRDDGYQYSWAPSLNEAGQVRGGSSRFDGSHNLGSSAWLYDGSQTLKLGFTNTEHTRNGGYQYSYARSLNEAGQVAGYSWRYSGSNDLGRSAWLYDGSQTLKLGFTDTEHTRNDGYQLSYAGSLNEAGQVAGFSKRYSGSNDLGQSAWLYDGSQTLRLGLTDAEHTRNGYQYSRNSSLNAAGQVAGYSYRFGGGRSAWLYDGSQTLKLGLTDAEHTRNDGHQSSLSQLLNEAGQVTGISTRFGGSHNLGQSAWLYDGSQTLKLGFTNTEHTRNDGYQNSWTQHLNEAGQVTGISFRYSGSNDLGRSAWLYDGSQTLRLGLTDAEHSRDDGYQYSDSDFLNEVGQVTGHSERYNGLSSLGQSAWLYDADLAQMFSLVFSERDDGYAYTDTEYLGEMGLVLGSYDLFDGANSLGTHAFAWTIEDGLFDLGELVDGGLDFGTWLALSVAIEANGLDQIVGHGVLTAGGQGVFLLSPTVSSVPVPAAIWLFGGGLVGLLGFRRIKASARIQISS